MICSTHRRFNRVRGALGVLLGLAGTGALLASATAVQAADLYYPQPHHDSYRDDDDSRSDWRPPYRRHARGDCVPREFVREELRADGWSDLHDPQLRGSVVVVGARRVGSGRPFELTIDRCSGDVISAVPLAPKRRAYLRPFNEDWRWRSADRWRDRADWQDDRLGRGRYGYRNAY